MSPYLYISDINKQMLSVGIKLFSVGQVQDYGAQMAAATLVLLPIIVVFLFCQRFFIENARLNRQAYIFGLPIVIHSIY